MPSSAKAEGGEGDADALYLCSTTFTGEAGVTLAAEVRTALANKLPIILVHENDPDRDGCEFSRFFETTPDDLILSGLYRTIAVACYPSQHRQVSLDLVAIACGAVPTGSAVEQLSELSVKLAAAAPGGGANAVRRVSATLSSLASAPAKAPRPEEEPPSFTDVGAAR